jgi:hypothetical protein
VKRGSKLKKFYLIASALLCFVSVPAMAQNQTVNGQLFIDGGNTSSDIRLKTYNTNDLYPQIIWYNSNGVNYNTIMGAHELAANGSWHNHFTIRTLCGDGVGTNCGRIDFEILKDHPEWKFTRTKVKIAPSSELVLESPDSTEWQIAIDDQGNIRASPYSLE